MMKSTLKLLFILFSLLLTACSFSMTGDVTPPPGADISAAMPTQSERTSTNVYPLVPPDPVSGKTIYAEKCASCHGYTGKGDGERAYQLPNPVTALNDLDIARQAIPSDWYLIIKNGNLERYMPPFPTLSDGQVWDVVAYLNQMNAVSSFQVLGKQSYEENCSRCHGEQAKGDGVDAAELSTQPTNLVDLAFMSGKSSVDIFQSITYGKIPNMPSFNDSIPEEERWAVIDYLRNLTFSSSEAFSPEPSEIITTTKK